MKKKKTAKYPQKEKEPRKQTFNSLQWLLSPIDYRKITSYLYHNEPDNPTRFVLNSFVEHSHIPAERLDFGVLSVIEKYTIVRVWRIIEAKRKAREEELKKLKKRRR